MSLEKKIQQSIRLLQSIPTDKEIELSYSGGKDSDVILELAKMAGIPVVPIYKNTTVDPPGTINHCLSKGVTMLRPKDDLRSLIERKGFPTRFARFCCQVLKEYKVKDVAIHGVRKSESAARNKRYQEPQVCRYYGSKKNHVSVFLPILEWTGEDVAEFIKQRNIQCHPLYYPNGEFDVTKRLGCIGCPLQSARGRREQFKQYPKMLRMWAKAGQKYYDTHPQSKAVQNFGNAINNLASQLFCYSYEKYLKMTEELPEGTDWCDYMEEYFNVKLRDIIEK